MSWSIVFLPQVLAPCFCHHLYALEIINSGAQSKYKILQQARACPCSNRYFFFERMSVFNMSSLRLTQFTRLCVREFSPAPNFLLRTLSTVREASSLRPQRQEAVEWHDEASNVKPNVLQESLVSSSSPIINGNHSAGSQRLPQRARAQQPRLDQPLCRDTLVSYFNESWSLTESLFSTLKPEAFFEVAIANHKS